MDGVLLGVLGASLLGSPHCAGMCGPFAVLGGPTAGTRAVYHGVRVAAYVALGGLAGALGAGLDLGGAAFGVQRAALVLAAATLIGAGLWLLLRPWLGSRFRPAPPAFVRRVSSGIARLAARRGPVARAALLGGASGLLPCGWLYAFVAAAAGTGAPVGGALVMLAFGAGTVPILFVVTLGARRLAEPLRRRAPLAVGAALLLAGAATLSGRFAVPPLRAAAAGAIDEIDTIDASSLPCCGGDEDHDAGD
ncbi:MAG: sulfite exporter TauE/SafE family protein [Planctomycetota bacterium JB042]